jgi:xanthine dehydrogenase molybdenum-binding subunit
VSKSLKYVGGTYPSHDAEQKAAGALVYSSDLKLPGMLYAKLLLSPVAHGLIKSIDTSRAETAPGVFGVFTHLNSPNTGYNRYRLLHDQEFCPEDDTLFTGKVRFVGDRMAAVVADSPGAADAAVSLITVKYEALPVMTTPEEVLRDGAVPIHESGNLLHEFDIILGEAPPPEEGDIRVETVTRGQRTHHAALEPLACLAACDSSGRLTVWSPSQGVYGARTVLADLFQLSYSKVRVIKIPTGGSFGGKQEFILEPVVAWLALATRRPVKLMFNREEAIIATSTRPATTSKISTVVSGDGRLKQCTVDTTFDAGAYATSSIDMAHAMAKKITRGYRIPFYRHRCRVAYTNTPIAGGMRGWGGSEITVASEIHLNQVARRLGIDPLDLRLTNLVHPFDVDPASGLSLGDARIIECLSRGAEAFDWRERYRRPPDGGRYRRGVGLACGAHKNGMYGGFPEYSAMTLRMNDDGSFILNTSIHEVGAGAVTAMKIIIAEVLDVDPDLITVTEADTEYTPYDFGTYGSRVTYVCGACAYHTASKMKERILDLASQMLQQPQQSLQVAEGLVADPTAQRAGLSYGEIANNAKLRYNTELTVAYTHYAASNPGAYAAQFAEVTVDTATGLVRVTDFLSANDIGRAINLGMVEGQVQGAVQMGIGYALCEEIKIGRDGQVLNTGFANYNLVNAPDMPDVKVLLIEHEGDEGPFGAKSVGEISALPTAPAVVNAVNQALGGSLSDLPLTPEKVLAEIRAGSHL